ncbi:MAG: hypothetical protein HY287_16655 [Planctomycetes bacterium]|nr:hypothetical protein [Planctomycetota bacterium]
MVLTCAVHFGGLLSFAQEIAAVKPTDLEHFVPAQGAVVISIDHPLEFDQVVSNAGIIGALRTTSAVPGAAPLADGIRGWLAEALGTREPATIDAVMRSEIAVLMPESFELTKSVLLVRLPNKDSLEQWFPNDGRHDTEIGEGAKLWRTADGRMLGTRDGVVAIARKSANGRLFREILRLMSGRSTTSLDRDDEYKQLSPYLPAKDLVSVYVPRAQPENSGSPLNKFGVRSMLAAAYKEEGRLNFAIRATRTRTSRESPLPESAIDEMMNLPSGTLFASATRWPVGTPTEKNVVDFASLMFAWVRPVYDLLKSAQPMVTDSGSIPVVLAATQDLTGEARGTPQFTIFVQSPKARLLCAEIMASLSELNPNSTQGGQGTANPLETKYVDQPIWYLPICADSGASDKLECILKLEPSWTSLGDWFILSSTQTQLRRVLDAQNGKASRLSTVPEAAAIRSRRAPRTAVALGQPFLATVLVDRWIEEAGRMEDSFAHVAWDIATDLTPPERGDRIGISARTEQVPGAVVVARVDSGTPASGRLRVGDRIIGTNGSLLSLESPNSDLRARWEKLLPEDRMILRVEHEDSTMVEAELVKPKPTALATSEMIPNYVVNSLLGVRSILRSIPIVTVSFPATDENHLSVFISLKVAPPVGAAASR